jgi:hypothetical protein
MRIPVLVLLLTALAATTATAARTPKSGIRGVAVAGPITPVERPGVKNTRPLAGAVITVQPAEGGEEIARQAADAQGRFTIPLPAGHYRLVPLPPNPDQHLPLGRPMQVTVSEGRFVRVTVRYDTGIR